MGIEHDNLTWPLTAWESIQISTTDHAFDDKLPLILGTVEGKPGETRGDVIARARARGLIDRWKPEQLILRDTLKR